MKPTPTNEHGLDRRDWPTLTPRELADSWGCCVATIRRDIAKGALKAYRLPGGRWRIRPSDARAYGKPQW